MSLSRSGRDTTPVCMGPAPPPPPVAPPSAGRLRQREARDLGQLCLGSGGAALLPNDTTSSTLLLLGVCNGFNKPPGLSALMACKPFRANTLATSVRQHSPWNCCFLPSLHWRVCGTLSPPTPAPQWQEKPWVPRFPRTPVYAEWRGAVSAPTGVPDAGCTSVCVRHGHLHTPRACLAEVALATWFLSP